MTGLEALRVQLQLDVMLLQVLNQSLECLWRRGWAQATARSR